MHNKENAKLVTMEPKEECLFILGRAEGAITIITMIG
jgi:hypothetical protein